jgi:hypothetical protein
MSTFRRTPDRTTSGGRGVAGRVRLDRSSGLAPGFGQVFGSRPGSAFLAPVRGRLASNVTLGYLLDEWPSGHQVEETTRASYRLLINGFIRPPLGATPLAPLCRQGPRPFEQLYAESADNDSISVDRPARTSDRNASSA